MIHIFPPLLTCCLPYGTMQERYEYEDSDTTDKRAWLDATSESTQKRHSLSVCSTTQRQNAYVALHRPSLESGTVNPRGDLTEDRIKKSSPETYFLTGKFQDSRYTRATLMIPPKSGYVKNARVREVDISMNLENYTPRPYRSCMDYVRLLHLHAR